MRIAVLGAGVVGVASAWYLREAGHDVTVFERREAAGLETSFANGGQISVSHAEPWASPAALAQVLAWLGREDAPLLFRLRMDPEQWKWGLRFLLECFESHYRKNTARLVKLGIYSRAKLRALRMQTGLRYDHLERGILHFYTDARELEKAAAHAGFMRSLGVDREVKSREQCVAIEPALAALGARLTGGTYSASDESGDAHAFTRELAKHCAASGVKFEYGSSIKGFAVDDDRIESVLVNGDPLRADAYVVSLGSYSPLVLRPIGISLPIYPVKGYSVTMPVKDPRAAWSVSLTDESRKLVFSRLGDRLRIAGTAELTGYDTSINERRCRAILDRTMDLFPNAGVVEKAEFWTGLRPATPSNIPRIGATRYRNLFLNTGHGTLGWTHACGSGRLIADIVSGRKPEIDF